jgi:threonine aldolase
VGSSDFIVEARKKRKIMGGGMRQVGFIAACGLIALDKMTGRVAEDNKRAKKLADLFARYPDIFEVDFENVKINMVFVRLKKQPEKAELFANLLAEKNILTYPPENALLRFVTHYYITDNDLNYVENALKEITTANF